MIPYARRSIKGAQFFSAMKPRSFLFAFSTAFKYSSLTTGYAFPISKPQMREQQRRREAEETASAQHVPPGRLKSKGLGLGEKVLVARSTPSDGQRYADMIR